MWLSNRKNAYKVVRVYKTKPIVKLKSIYGCEFKVKQSDLDACNYKPVKQKPAFLGRT